MRSPPAGVPRHAIRRIAAGALGLTAALGLAACGSSPRNDGGESARVPVETVVVPAKDVDVTVSAVGTLEADQAVELKAKRAGHVRELRFVEGERVEPGAVLVELDDRELRARLDVARAGLVEAEVRERDARRLHERTARLKRSGVASEQAYDDALAALDRAVAGLDVARANLAFAEAQLADTVIRAPFGGIVGRRLVDRGAFVKEGEPLVSLVDVDPLEIVFAVPERWAANVRRGQPIEAKLASHGERVFFGNVTFVDPKIDAVNRLLTVKGVIPNPDGELRPGQFANAWLRLDRRPAQPVIPEEALVPDGERTLVFVVEAGQAAARPIETGVRTPGEVEVISGLAVGETIVRTGHEKLKVDAALPVVEVRLDVPDTAARRRGGG